MAENDNSGRLSDEFFTPGISSFTEFLAGHRPPHCCPPAAPSRTGSAPEPTNSRTAPRCWRSPTATAY